MATPTIAMIPSGYKAGTVYSVLPVDGTGDFDFTRASSATRVNESGLIELVATGVPRLDYTGGGCPSLLLEPQSTNLYLNSDTLVTQNITTTASTYTVSFYGTGTITFSGTYAGSLVGTGVSDRVSLTFTATAGTLINTISGTVENGQCENLSYATSYIPTAGATVTRVADAASKTGLSSYINSTEGVLYAEISGLANDGTFKAISISDGSTSNVVRFYKTTTNNQLSIRVTLAGVNQFNVVHTLSNSIQNNKLALKYKENDFAFWVNGIEVAAIQTGTTFSLNTLNKLSFSEGNGASPFYGNTKDVRVYSTALTDTELQTLTTL
jgi:hypothetical protein